MENCIARRFLGGGNVSWKESRKKEGEQMESAYVQQRVDRKAIENNIPIKVTYVQERFD